MIFSYRSSLDTGVCCPGGRIVVAVFWTTLDTMVGVVFCWNAPPVLIGRGCAIPLIGEFLLTCKVVVVVAIRTFPPTGLLVFIDAGWCIVPYK